MNLTINNTFNQLKHIKMKRNLLLFTLAMSLGLASCGKMEGQLPAGEEGEVTVNFSLGYGTKATSGIDDDAVNTAYVFAFDGDRIDGSSFVESASGTIRVTSGLRQFVAVVNPKSEFSFTQVSTVDDVMDLVSQLSEEGLADMIMIGEKSETITDATTSITIPVTRLVSKISVNSLKFQLKGALSEKPISDVAIYIKNYPTTQTYSGIAGNSYTSGLYADNQSSFEVYDFVGSMIDGSTETGHHFFCYNRVTAGPATGKNAIRLCITAKIDGQKYYWSLPVNNGANWTADAFIAGDEHYGVMRNHSYEYDITITRAGVPDDGSEPDPTDPDDNGEDELEDDEDLSTSDINFILNVLDFVEVSEQTITF